MEMHIVTSGHIEAVGYDEDTEVMVVRFRNGSEYAYPHTSYSTFKQILEAPSVGSAINACGIKGQRC